MFKILLLSHGKMCEGILDTLKIFTPKTDNITAIPFYVEGIDSEEMFTRYVEDIQTEDLVIACSDIMWGSVNQQAMVQLSTRENVHLISGMNLPILLELIACNPDEVTESLLSEKVESCKEALVYMRNVKIDFNENDE